VGLSDTILKGTHPGTIPARFGLIWFSSFRGEDLNVIFYQNIKMYVFYADGKSKMSTTAIHRLTLDPMGKCSNAFFSETTNIIKAKLYMNVHWPF
jgi:hypothetical protein